MVLESKIGNSGLCLDWTVDVTLLYMPLLLLSVLVSTSISRRKSSELLCVCGVWYASATKLRLSNVLVAFSLVQSVPWCVDSTDWCHAVTGVHGRNGVEFDSPIANSTSFWQPTAPLVVGIRFSMCDHTVKRKVLPAIGIMKDSAGVFSTIASPVVVKLEPFVIFP